MKKSVLVTVLIFSLAPVLLGQAAKLGGSLTAELGVRTSAAGPQLLSVGGGLALFPVRYFGGGADLIYGFKTYSQEATSGSYTEKSDIDVVSIAIDAYFAPHIDFERGRLYPMGGLTIYSLKVEQSTGSTTIKYDYGTNVGIVVGVGAEVIVKKQIVLGVKIKERLVTGKEESVENSVKYTTDTPVGGPEALFTIGLNF